MITLDLICTSFIYQVYYKLQLANFSDSGDRPYRTTSYNTALYKNEQNEREILQWDYYILSFWQMCHILNEKKLDQK